MRRQPPRPIPVQNEVIIFTGGLKQDIPQLQLKSGELLSGFNYQEEDGNTFGYRSISGYERYDGTALASSVDGNAEDDTDREARRTAITEVPGQGNVQGVHIYETEVFAVREDTTDPTRAYFYKATGSGWSTAISSVDRIETDGSYQFCNSRFDLLTGFQREPIFIFTNGVNYPMYYNGTSFVTISGGDLPTDVFPKYCVEFNNRLFLGYEDGRVFFSAVGDPTDFDGVNGAGEIYYESPITGFVVTPGDALAIFCEDNIHTLQSLSTVEADSSGVLESIYKFQSKVFSNRSGSLPYTQERVLGKIIYMDDRGVTSLSQSDVFGDFDMASVSKNVQGALLSRKNLTTCSVVNREKNQYRLFFSDSTGYIFTWNIEKKIKGVTQIKYNNPVLTVSEGKDDNGDDFIVFSSNNGYVYLMDSGTSFDGEVITTRLSTSFYSYRSPSNWKRFHKILLETTAGKDLRIAGRANFNYKNPFMPRTDGETFEGEDAGGIWGTDKWGEFVYSSTVIQTPTLYLTGVGNNMSITISTSDKYSSPHIIQSAVVDYSILERVA
jgi:hypothetical protein